MSRWICPRCDREFGAANQAHTCVPGITVDTCFLGRAPQQRLAYDAVIDFLRTLGPVHEDAVGVGVFVKRTTKLAELRPFKTFLSLELVLPDEVTHPRITRAVRYSAHKVWHRIRLSGPEDVDAAVRDWLARAYHYAG